MVAAACAALAVVASTESVPSRPGPSPGLGAAPGSSTRSTTPTETAGGGDRLFALPSTGLTTAERERTFAYARGPFEAALVDGTACAWLGNTRAQRTTEIRWPVGYRVAFDPIRLVGPDGQLVAHEGEDVVLGGGGAGSQTTTTSDPCRAAGSPVYVAVRVRSGRDPGVWLPDHLVNRPEV